MDTPMDPTLKFSKDDGLLFENLERMYSNKRKKMKTLDEIYSCTTPMHESPSLTVVEEEAEAKLVTCYNVEYAWDSILNSSLLAEVNVPGSRGFILTETRSGSLTTSKYSILGKRKRFISPQSRCSLHSTNRSGCDVNHIGRGHSPRAELKAKVRTLGGASDAGLGEGARGGVGSSTEPSLTEAEEEPGHRSEIERALDQPKFGKIKEQKDHLAEQISPLIESEKARLVRRLWHHNLGELPSPSEMVKIIIDRFASKVAYNSNEPNVLRANLRHLRAWLTRAQQSVERDGRGNMSIKMNISYII
ncbi:hypothetical protein CQW23_13483 [Capsicum baccatum]|uniref:Uncharacterized protein n=1 Tax=Capsicum baccatum TaxID=33114 RepID=A0A2G2WVL5_CAPBA|nr:hypothetical protein CQW23_13483 [Capsicum baccatum]